MCGQSTWTCPHPQQSADSHRQQCFSGPSPQSHKQRCFPGPSKTHKLQAISGPSLTKSLIPRPVKGTPSLARPSVLSWPPLPHNLGKLPLCILWPPGVNKAITVYPSEEDLLLHLSTLVPLPSVCANQETQMPCSALTPPVTPREEMEAESPDSLDSQASNASYSLCLRLPITYNEAALSWLQGRLGYHMQQPVHTLPKQHGEQYRWHQWQHFHRWNRWHWWLPCRSCGRFIMPTERITDRRDRQGHAYPTRCPADHIQGHRNA